MPPAAGRPPHEQARPGAAGRLGPHLVGARVVLRFRVPGRAGPSGGPLLDDVLGVLEAWDGEVAVVRPDRPGATNEPVRVPLADLVTGKPVPPRTPPRLRISAADAERRAVSGWPPVDSEPLGEWLLRAAGGFSSRANSVLAIGDPGRDAATASAAVLAWYASRSLPARAQVVTGSDEHTLLDAQGWVPARPGEADSELHLVSTATVRRALAALPRRGCVPGPLRVEVREDLRDDWLAADARAQRFPEAARAVLAGPAVTGFAVATDPTTGTLLARGRVSVNDDWAGLSDLWVAPEVRRGGLGTGLVAELVAWATERGALTAYLQTRADNPGALALYARLGFALHHRYRYLRHPGGTR